MMAGYAAKRPACAAFSPGIRAFTHRLRGYNRYLTPNMLRQLLTLLAVISGFTLAAEPVAAAQGAVVSVASTDQKTDCQPVVVAPAQLVPARQIGVGSPDRLCINRPVVVTPPTVQLQADRARE